MRYLRQWKYHGRGVGRFLVNAMPVAVFVLMIAAEAEAIVTHGTRDQAQAANTQIAQKERIEQELLKKHTKNWWRNLRSHYSTGLRR